MSVLPVRNVVLTAASTDVADVQAAVYADLLANSTWTLPNQDPITAGAPGSYAFTARNPTGTIELNIKNAGTPAAPALTAVRLGINPDGVGDPILNASAPSSSAANFSGTDDGRLTLAANGNAEVLLFEFDDSLMVLFKDAARTYTPGGWYWGKTLIEPIAALTSTGNLRIDGHCIFGPTPGTVADQWLSNHTTNYSPTRRRIALGKESSSAGSGITGSWADPTAAAIGLYQPTLQPIDAIYKYGPLLERIVHAGVLKSVAQGSASSDTGLICKHLRMSSAQLLFPFDFWSVGGVAQYMVIGPSAAWSGLCIPVRVPFDPNP